MSFGDVTEKDIYEAIETAKKEGKYTNLNVGGWEIDDFVKRVLIQLLSFRTRKEMEEDQNRKKEKEKDNRSAKQRMIDLHKVWRNSSPVDNAARAELVELMEEHADTIISVMIRMTDDTRKWQRLETLIRAAKKAQHSFRPDKGKGCWCSLGDENQMPHGSAHSDGCLMMLKFFAEEERTEKQITGGTT